MGWLKGINLYFHKCLVKLCDFEKFIEKTILIINIYYETLKQLIQENYKEFTLMNQKKLLKKEPAMLPIVPPRAVPTTGMTLPIAAPIQPPAKEPADCLAFLLAAVFKSSPLTMSKTVPVAKVNKFTAAFVLATDLRVETAVVTPLFAAKFVITL